MKLDRRAIAYPLLAAVAVAALVWWVWPAPPLVETATVGRGDVQAAIDEDGETRAVDRFGIASPVAGRMLRVILREGDTVKPGDAVAEIAPLPIAASDRDMLAAKLEAARALKSEADERVRQADITLEQAERERRRVEDLVKKAFMSQQALEQAEVAERSRAAEAKAARSRAVAANYEVDAARAALTAIRDRAPTLRVTSPVAGRVLRIAEKSERVVQPGTLLVTVGDPAALEIVVDVLSNDAVRVRPGMTMLLTGWGGAQAVEAKVRLVEPAAFRKVSALGVEEQRVNVIADFTKVPEGLGDAFRVDARIIVDERQGVLRVPVGALFRRGERWATFVVNGSGRLELRMLEVGLRGARDAEVKEGLKEGDRVVLYPGNTLVEGSRVRPRG